MFARPSTTPSRIARSFATPITANSRRVAPLFTPSTSSSMHRNTMVPMTAEKAPVDDKLFVQAKTQQVLEELAGVDGFTELVQKGLKSMTLKQFIMILQHFLKPIVGSNFVLDQSNYVGYMHNFLITMEYPYTINKSSLKTPSAPHCHASIVILLAWMSEFTVKESEDEPLFQYSTNTDLNTPALAKMFMEKSAKAFSLWNNEREAESEDVFKEISQTYVKKKIGSGENLDIEIERLKQSIDDLNKETKPNSLYNRCEEKNQEMNALAQQYEEMNKAIKENKCQIKNLKAELKMKKATKAGVAEELSSFRTKLLSQEFTKEQKNAQLLAISEAKSVLAGKKQTASEVSEACSEKEIKLSLTIQKKFKLIETCNNLIYKLASDLEIAGWEGDFDPSKFEIKATKIGDENNLSKEIKRLDRGLTDLKAKCQQVINAACFNASEEKLKEEKNQLATEDSILTQELEMLDASIEKICAEEKLLETEQQNCIRSNTKICKHFDDEIKAVDEDNRILTENITKFKELNSKLAFEQKKFQETSLVKVKAFYNKRKKEIQEQRQKVDEIKQLLNRFHQINQLFPGDVQKTIDEAMKKRNG